MTPTFLQEPEVDPDPWGWHNRKEAGGALRERELPLLRPAHVDRRPLEGPAQGQGADRPAVTGAARREQAAAQDHRRQHEGGE